MTPAAKPKNAFCNLSGISFEKKNTTEEPAIVIKNVNPVPRSAVKIELGMKESSFFKVIISYAAIMEMFEKRLKNERPPGKTGGFWGKENSSFQY